MGGDHSGAFTRSYLAAEQSRAEPKGGEDAGEEQVQAADLPPLVTEQVLLHAGRKTRAAEKQKNCLLGTEKLFQSCWQLCNEAVSVSICFTREENNLRVVNLSIYH